MNELPSIYAENTLDPPGSHFAATILAAVYLLLLTHCLVWWLVEARRARRARDDRTGVLREGPAQVLTRIAGDRVIVPAVSESVAELPVEPEPFQLEAGGGIVRVEAEGRAVFRMHGARRALEGGDYVEVAGMLERETVVSTDGYRGDAKETWVLRPPKDGAVIVWRSSRTYPFDHHADLAVGGFFVVALLMLMSALSLTGYLARVTLGETGTVELVSTHPSSKGVTLVVDLDHDDLEHILVPEDEAAPYAPGDALPYRFVPALPWCGALGPGAAIPGYAFFFAILFTLFALGTWVAVIAVRLEGDE